MNQEELSKLKFIEVEQKILSTLPFYKTEFVTIEKNFETDLKIWTISMNTRSENTPLVLLHGFAAGLGMWLLNFEALSKDRPLYALDLLGFGRSSRATFSKDGGQVEKEMVDAIEAWRKQMKLEKFILLGHSMGAFLGTVYAMTYPDRIEHLILADHWGFTDKYDNPPLCIKIIVYLFQNFKPLNWIRNLGPYWGPLLLQKTRRDIFGKFGEKLQDGTILPTYIYYCNDSMPATGEVAFYSMVLGVGWAKYPIIKRINKLRKNIPMTFMYGSYSWMDKEMGPKIKTMRPDSFVDIHIIEGAGHHIYSEQSDKFNEIVINACKYTDQQKTLYTITHDNTCADS